MPKKKHKPKYIFVVGGVLSGVGKGVTTASIGAILKSKGFRVTALKADPYVNIDAGTMNPTEHGEVFVTDDGDETDQDMGNYERFLGIDLTSTNYMTTGRVYQSVLANERAMKYKGKCVQVVPHVPEEIIRRIKKATRDAQADIALIEIGGTVGEYENILFMEAARMMKFQHPEDVAFVLVSYLPVPSHLGEMKTKPTQHAARTLSGTGINADFIIARGVDPLDTPRREKLARFCGVPKEHCISAPDVESIYDVPLNFEKEGLGNKILRRLSLKGRTSDLRAWEKLARKRQKKKATLSVAVVGKYFGTGKYTLSDSYISVIEAVKHAAWDQGCAIDMQWIDAEEFEDKPKSVKMLNAFDAILVPGGFGTRGIEGIMQAIRFAREQKIPYLGLCYGMQLACVEFVRNVLGKKHAHSVEVNPDTEEPVIYINPNQAKNMKEDRYGGTMRLGAYDCVLRKGSLARKAYKADMISERHRHRYEFNNAYREEVDAAGLHIVGLNPESDLVEIVELADHPFFVGVQFHPEFKSSPMKPHPLFAGLVKAGLGKKKT